MNPTVDHPRWSQATERRIGGGLFASRQDTLMFNGYDEVAPLYEGMDLDGELLRWRPPRRGRRRSTAACARSRPGRSTSLGFAWMALALLAGRSPDYTLIEPIDWLEREYGITALQLLCATLAVTPLRRFVGLNLLKFRRALGLLVFCFVLAHFLVWALLDVQALGAVWADIVKRPYVTIGMAAFLLLIPLALTSNDWSLRRLGGAGVAPAPLAHLPGRRPGGRPLHLAVPRLGRRSRWSTRRSSSARSWPPACRGGRAAPARA